MFNLYQIVTGAQGGQALENIAGQFGISREQADNAVKALMPALSTAFMTKAAQPGGLGDLAGAMTDDQHRQVYADPGAAQEPAAQQKGGDVVGNIFGNNAIVQQVVRQAAAFTGLPEATLQQMLPVITSMVIGGTATALHSQGFGGMLGQLAHGGLGNILSQFGGPAGAATGNGFPGMIGNIFTSFFSGTSAAPQTASSNPAGALPPVMQAGMDALLKMFQPGVAGPGSQPSASGGKNNASFNEKS